MMDNFRMLDRKSINEMLVKNEIRSVNQVAAQIKLTEAQKSTNNEKYPRDMKKKWGEAQTERKDLRPGSRRELEEGGKTWKVL